MKYINFKRLKFSTIFKNINFRRYNFSKIIKFVDPRRLDFKNIYKYLDFIRIDFKKFYKYLDLRRFNIDIRRSDFTKLVKYLNPRTYKINLFSSKFVLIHLPASIIFFVLLYLVIPTFYNYDKSNIENIVCKRQNIECSIRGEVNYSFFPTPRIKIKDVIIKDFYEKKNTFIKAEHTVIKLSVKNLLTKEKHKFKNIELNNFEINFDLKNLKKYKNIFKNKTNLIPVVFTKGQIVFLNEKDYVAIIKDTNLNLILGEYSKEAELKGKFLNDNIYISLNSNKVDNKSFTDVILKMSDFNLLTKANFSNSEKDENIINGNILIKKDKHRFTGVFDYKDNEITINKSNLKNIFLDGKLEGKIKFLPFFDFDLDLNLNSINFTKLYNHFLNLNENDKKKLFKISNKINGKLNFSSDKVYSRYNLVKSFESRIKFYNGNVSIDQFLLNLGKLGAADILGGINNDKKFANFKFESNIFVDNSKKFLSKFGIYNRHTLPSNLFISGIFDLDNIRISFYEISSDKELNREDVDYIEREFNDLMLEDGYTNLFYFPIFKEFLKSIVIEKN